MIGWHANARAVGRGNKLPTTTYKQGLSISHHTRERTRNAAPVLIFKIAETGSIRQTTDTIQYHRHDHDAYMRRFWVCLLQHHHLFFSGREMEEYLSLVTWETAREFGEKLGL